MQYLLGPVNRIFRLSFVRFSQPLITCVALSPHARGWGIIVLFRRTDKHVCGKPSTVSLPESTHWTHILIPSMRNSISMASTSTRDGRPYAPSTNALPEPSSTNDKQLPAKWIFTLHDSCQSFKVDRVLGKGSFGTVYHAKNLSTNEVVAIKRITVPSEYANQEIDMLRVLRHRNVVDLKHSFKTNAGDKKEVFIVMEYLPCDLSRLILYYRRKRTRMMGPYIMVYIYQLLNGLSFIHEIGIAHRDLKPSNILIDLNDHALKICDFGSARVLRKDRQNTSYICSRHYRAPELLLGRCYYTTAVDMWSCGCILAELYLRQALFAGMDNIDQLKQIFMIRGTPSEKEMKELGQAKIPLGLKKYPRIEWREIFGDMVEEDAIDLLDQMMTYSPMRRISASDALLHRYFDPLRKKNFLLPLGTLPPLFDDEEAEREIREVAHE